MWRKTLSAFLLVLVFFTAWGGVALADDHEGPSARLTMNGQAAVVGAGQSRQLRIKTRSSEPDGWLMEINLSPTRAVYDGDEDIDLLEFNGSFTLGLSGQPLDSGTAKGWIDGSNSGILTLKGRQQDTSLEVSFTLNPGGSVASRVSGSWPQSPVAAGISLQPADHTFWYVSRASGILAFILLFLSVAVGLASRYTDRVLKRWRSLDLHRFLSLVTLPVLALHMVSLLGDKYFEMDLAGLLVPFAGPYRPLWTTMGIIAFYMMLVVVFSSYLKKFIGARGWRVIHNMAFVIFFMALVHSILAGSDTNLLWVQWMYVSTGTTAVFLFLWRFKESVFGRLSGARNEYPVLPAGVEEAA